MLTRIAGDQKGFTLIELLIVVAVIAILAAIAIPNFINARKRSTLSASKANLKSVATALETYAADNDAYPVQATEGDLSGISGDLVPTYINSLPTDPTGGGQYRYDSDAGGTEYLLKDPHLATSSTHLNSSAAGASAYVEEGGEVKEATGAFPAGP